MGKLDFPLSVFCYIVCIYKKYVLKYYNLACILLIGCITIIHCDLVKIYIFLGICNHQVSLKVHMTPSEKSFDSDSYSIWKPPILTPNPSWQNF